MARSKKASSKGDDVKKISNGIQKKKKSVTKPEQQVEELNNDEVEILDDTPTASTSSASAAKRAPSTKKKTPAKKTPTAPSRGSGRQRKAPVLFQAQPTPSTSTRRRRRNKLEEFPVEAIRGIKKNGPQWEFLVKWEGYRETSNNWEPETNVQSCNVHVTRFLESANRHFKIGQ